MVDAILFTVVPLESKLPKDRSEGAISVDSAALLKINKEVSDMGLQYTRQSTLPGATVLKFTAFIAIM